MPQGPPSEGQVPVVPGEIRIEEIGVNALDAHRVDVAVDLIPCREAVDIEMVIVGPDDEELSSTVLIHNREWKLDKIMHLRREAQPGECTLHVGVFCERELVTHAAKTFRFPPAAPE